MNHRFNVNYLFSRLHVHHLKTATSPLSLLCFPLPLFNNTQRNSSGSSVLELSVPVMLSAG